MSLRGFNQVQNLGFALSVAEESTLVSVVDDLEAAGTLASFTCVVLSSSYEQTSSAELCGQLLRLPSLQLLEDSHALTRSCDDSGTLQKLATSLSQITYLNTVHCSENSSRYASLVLQCLTTL